MIKRATWSSGWAAMVCLLALCLGSLSAAELTRVAPYPASPVIQAIEWAPTNSIIQAKHGMTSPLGDCTEETERR